LRKQREVLEAQQREAYEQAERQMPQPEEISGTADAFRILQRRPR